MKFRGNRADKRARREHDLVYFGPTLCKRVYYAGGRKAHRARLRIGPFTLRCQSLINSYNIRDGKRASGLPETKMIHMSDVLTAATCRLLSFNGLQGAYDFATFMNRTRAVITTDLMALMPLMQKSVLSQHPQLKNLIDPDEKLSPDNIRSWVQKQIDHFGAEYLPIRAGL